jgi:hypothetical protein
VDQIEIAATAADTVIGHHVDSQDALGKLPKLFGDLVEGGEPTDVAFRSVVALLVGEA